MKTYRFILVALAYIISAATFVSCGDDDAPEAKGGIYGVVTDKATGEPLKSAGVELLPLGLKTVTGSEGNYEFINLSVGSYNLLVTKTGYIDSKSNTIAIKSGQSSQYDFQMELLPPALKVVDDSRHEITELVFGNSESDVSRSFNIFNDGAEKLEWEISASVDWIKSFSKEQGILAAGGTQSIILTIDREKLKGGEEVTTIHVTSDNGSKQITVKVVSDIKTLPQLNTLAVSDIHLTAAVFNGEIMDAGSPSYTERGFVYATTSMPTTETTIKKLTVAVDSENKYACTATGLEEGKTYYVRAYAINKTGTAYSTNEVSFKPAPVMPEVKTLEVTNITATSATLHGIIVNPGEPCYTEKGFVYGTMSSPTLDDTEAKVAKSSGTSTGAYTRNASNLTTGKTYYVRAYAKVDTNVTYGDVVKFTCSAPEYVTLSYANIMVQKKDLGSAYYGLAVDACKNSVVGGYRDWRLPTQAELKLLYDNRNEIGGFKSGCYWCDSDFDNYYYHYFDFSDGDSGTTYYYYSYEYNIRAVRTITK